MWTPEHGRFCLSLVARADGVDLAEVARRFGADPAVPVTGTATQREADELAGTVHLPVVRLGELGGWVFGLEHRPDGQGQRIEVLRRLSAGTTAVVVDADGRHVRLRHAEDSDLIFGYDSSDPDHRLGLEPDRHVPALTAARLLPFDQDRPAPHRPPAELAAGILDVAAAITGLPLTGSLGEALAGRLRYARLLPLLADPVAVPYRWPVRVDPALVAKVAYAREEQLRPALVAQARRRMAATGLDTHPEVRSALAEAAAGPTRQADADSPLGLLLRRIDAAARTAPAADDPRHRHREGIEAARAAAAKALHVLLAGPPSAAVYEVLGTPEQFDDRDAFLAALAAVEPPPDAVARLEEHQQAQARKGPKLPVRFPRR